MQDTTRNLLNQKQLVWLITGVAGFIGSHLLETLLQSKQKVVGLDNFITGHKKNLEHVRQIVGDEGWSNFQFVEGDITDYGICKRICSGVDYVLHQAALGSVPRSISDPVATNTVNIGGFLNMLSASRDEGVKRFVYAASSSTYGDHPALPKKEEIIGRPLSPYAVTKYVNELYADVFSRTFGIPTVGLRYFNVFGPRQDPDGAYAAVIPKWIAAMASGNPVFINGDGSTSRDFCFVKNVVDANILAALCDPTSGSNVFNIACGDSTSLNELFSILKCYAGDLGYRYDEAPVYRDFRAGDVLHSKASVAKAEKYLGYRVNHRVKEGLQQTVSWFLEKNVKPL